MLKGCIPAVGSWQAARGPRPSAQCALQCKGGILQCVLQCSTGEIPCTAVQYDTEKLHFRIAHQHRGGILQCAVHRRDTLMHCKEGIQCTAQGILTAHCSDYYILSAQERYSSALQCKGILRGTALPGNVKQWASLQQKDSLRMHCNELSTVLLHSTVHTGRFVVRLHCSALQAMN